jgi:hypothetical protein
MAAAAEKHKERKLKEKAEAMIAMGKQALDAGKQAAGAFGDAKDMAKDLGIGF